MILVFVSEVDHSIVPDAADVMRRQKSPLSFRIDECVSHRTHGPTPQLFLGVHANPCLALLSLSIRPDDPRGNELGRGRNRSPRTGNFLFASTHLVIGLRLISVFTGAVNPVAQLRTLMDRSSGVTYPLGRREDSVRSILRACNLFLAICYWGYPSYQTCPECVVSHKRSHSTRLYQPIVLHPVYGLSTTISLTVGR